MTEVTAPTEDPCDADAVHRSDAIPRPPKKPKAIDAQIGSSEKAKGELVEVIFMVKAQALGLSISKPYGDNQAFDFHVYGPAGTFRVQVKSGWRPQGPRYTAQAYKKSAGRLNGVDFLVVYIAPQDFWYVIPASKVVTRAVRMYPHVPHSRGRYEKYRNAWRLITGNPADDTHRIGLTIHASVDPDYESEEEEEGSR